MSLKKIRSRDSLNTQFYSELREEMSFIDSNCREALIAVSKILNELEMIQFDPSIALTTMQNMGIQQSKKELTIFDLEQKEDELREIIISLGDIEQRMATEGEERKESIKETDQWKDEGDRYFTETQTIIAEINRFKVILGQLGLTPDLFHYRLIEKNKRLEELREENASLQNGLSSYLGFKSLDAAQAEVTRLRNRLKAMEESATVGFLNGY
ncbi:hypothetical protein PCE1_001094 [Barthelona sp. PCE]